MKLQNNVSLISLNISIVLLLISCQTLRFTAKFLLSENLTFTFPELRIGFLTWNSHLNTEEAFLFPALDILLQD